jgi:hypothetical protein
MLYMEKIKGCSKKTCWIMVQAANIVIRCDPSFSTYYERRARSG